MKRAAVCILGILLVGLTHTPAAAQITQLHIFNWGITQVTREANPSARSNQGVYHFKTRDQRLIQKTQKIPAVRGTSFGIFYQISGMPMGAIEHITIVIHTPQITPPGKTPYTSVTYQRTVTIGQQHYSGYTFDEIWEMVPGYWTFQFIYRGQVLNQGTFLVYRP